MRLDIREQLRAAAEAERKFNDTRVALISPALVEASGIDWSDPVRMRIVESAESPFVEIEVRRQPSLGEQVSKLELVDGDVALVRVPPEMTSDQALMLREQLREAIGDVRAKVVVMSSALEIRALSLEEREEIFGAAT